MGLRFDERVWNWVSGFGVRVRSDGADGTWKWIYGHGVPKVLKIPILKYHRITDKLYVGPQHGKLGKRVLERAGVTASLSLRLVYNDVERGVGFLDYYQISTLDRTAPTIEELRNGVAFIRRVIEDGGGVYIHCHGGLGRGPTMAAAYLISEGRSTEEACNMIRSVRPFTEIQPVQMQRLKEFELESFGSGH